MRSLCAKVTPQFNAVHKVLFCNSDVRKPRRNKIQRQVVVVKHVATPDAAARLRRAYSLIIQAAERLVRSDGKSGDSPTEGKANTDDPYGKEGPELR